LCILEPCGEERHREAPLDRRPCRMSGELHWNSGCRLLPEVGDRPLAIGGSELLVGVGERRQHSPAAIILDGVDIDIVARNLDLWELYLERAGGSFTHDVWWLKFRWGLLIA